MRKRLLYALLAAGLVLIALVAYTSTATAEKRSFQVRLADGSVVTVTVDVPPGTPIDEIPLPGQLIAELPGPDDVPAPSVPAPGAPPSGGGGGGGGGGGSGGGSGNSSEPSADSGDRGSSDDGSPRSHHGHRQGDSGSKHHADRGDDSNDEAQDEGSDKAKKKKHSKRHTKTRLRRPDGAPTRTNPTYFDALPGPTTVNGVPNFVIRKFRVPLFLLPIYQAAGIEYGVRWEYLAAINEIETDYGRNLNVSSAGAVGWMQFMPSTWKLYGLDANKDARKHPVNAVAAIFAAARYLRAAGGDKDIQKAVFAYNHAGWYVDSVMLRARMIAGAPADLVGSLTGLTEGHFPVYARARYADDLAESTQIKRVKR